MKNLRHHISVEALVGQRLAAIGATNIPTSARQVIEDGVWAAVAVLVQRRISGPVVGRAVARALAAPATNVQGLKGGTPLTSSALSRGAEASVTGRTPLPATAQPATASGGPDQLPEGANA
jgi:hypothetical protein